MTRCDIEVWVAEADLPHERAQYIAGRLQQYAADLVHDADPNADQPDMHIGSNVSIAGK